MRANNMLGATSEGDGIDPFNYEPFYKVLNWHANIATPDGRTPPFDDGNKKKIRSANLLSWSSAYGNDHTGKLFANIRDKLGNSGSFVDYRLIEIAIPRREKNTGISPPQTLGNSSSSELSDQQNVLRFNDSNGQQHYVFMNGEHGDAIIRGEGHEQPDQLQLLYYVDDQSYLMDSGYDAGGPKENSSWNGYSKHNTMQLVYSEREEYITGHVKYENYGGLEGPAVKASKARKVSEHNNIQYNYIQQDNQNIAVLKGAVNLHTELLSNISLYERNIIVVKDSSPYIIDFNSIGKIFGDNIQYRMRYNSPEANSFRPVEVRGDIDWETLKTDNLNMYRWWRPIEYQYHPGFCPDGRSNLERKARELPSNENGVFYP